MFDSDIFIYDTPEDLPFSYESCATLDVFCYLRNGAKWALYEFEPVKYTRQMIMK